MGNEPGCSIALKILSRGKGVYILVIISSLLLYYSIYVKHPQISDLLIFIGLLNISTALLSDSDSHNTIFYVLRISGAKPSTVRAYIITASLVTSLIGLIPIAIKAELIKVLAALFVDALIATLILYMMYLRIKRHLTSIIT
ncbi:MAG: hypothetical protein QXZ10_02445 [Sulfolobales archaeon]